MKIVIIAILVAVMFMGCQRKPQTIEIQYNRPVNRPAVCFEMDRCYETAGINQIRCDPFLRKCALAVVREDVNEAIK